MKRARRLIAAALEGAAAVVAEVAEAVTAAAVVVGAVAAVVAAETAATGNIAGASLKRKGNNKCSVPRSAEHFCFPAILDNTGEDHVQRRRNRSRPVSNSRLLS